MEFLENQVDGYGEEDEVVIWHHKKGGYRDREQSVYRDLATGKSQPVRGLFRVLVSTKMNRMIFTAMLMCLGLVFIISILGGKANQGTVGGVFCDMTAFSFGDDVYVSVSMRESKSGKNADSGKIADGNLHFVFTAVNSDGADADLREDDYDFDALSENVCRVTFKNYEIAAVKATVSRGEQTIDLSCKVEAR